jgi:arylsulfatase A-like enzyme|eukprot:COSAG02_NODE_13508_length_1385_cov_1.265941_1_plen_52_part_00
MPVYHQMLWDADLYVGRLVDAVKARGMWNNAVIFYSADNGTSNADKGATRR